MTEKRLCTNCKHSRGLGYDFWCGEGHIKYEKYFAETDCPYFEVMDLQDNDFNNTENDSTNSRNEKRFTYDFVSVDCPMFYDNKEVIDYDDVVDCLNEQHETIQEKQHTINEMAKTIRIYDGGYIGLNKRHSEYKQKVEDTLKTFYDTTKQLKGNKLIIAGYLDLINHIADELGVELK